MTDNFLRRLKNVSLIDGLEKRVDDLENSLQAVPRLVSELVRCLDRFLKLNAELATCFESIFVDTSLDKLVTHFKQAQEGVILSVSHFMNVSSCKSLESLKSNIDDVKSRRETYCTSFNEYKKCQKAFDTTCKDRRYSTKVLENAQQALTTAGDQFSRQDSQMSEVLENLAKTSVEVAGPVFFTLVEGQFRLVQHLSGVLAPFSGSSEAGRLSTAPPTHPVLSEAVAQWLSAHHTSHQLLTSEGLNRTDLQALVRCRQDGLVSQLKAQLSSRIDSLIQNYLSNLKGSSTQSFNMLGGFRYKPAVIQSVLKECCTNAEAKAAGAPVPLTEPAQDAQIMQDVPYMVLSVASRQLRAATSTSSRDCLENVKEKQEAIYELISELTSEVVSMDALEAFSRQILLELCSTVTLTASRTAVQLIFGKANMVAVCPSQNRSDVAPVVIDSAGDGIVKIVTNSSWWLVEDFMSLLPLRLAPKSLTPLGVVDVTYTQELSLMNFVENSGNLELPQIDVTYRASSSPISYPPAAVVADAKPQHRRSLTKVDDLRAITDDIDNKSDCSNKTGSTIMSRRKYDSSYGKHMTSKSSYSSVGMGENLQYSRSIGGSSGSISSATTLTGKLRPETDDIYSVIQSTSHTSYLNPSRLQEHTQSEAEKVGRGGWKRRQKLDEEAAKTQRDVTNQLPFLMGLDHSSSEDLALQEDYSRSRRYSDQGWSTGSSQEANQSLSNSSLNDIEVPITRSRGSSFHSGEHHLHDTELDNRSVLRSSRPGSKKKPGESGISIDSGITSSDNSQENQVPTSSYIPRLETNSEKENNNRGRTSTTLPTSQYSGYYDTNRYNSLPTPNADSSSEEGYPDMVLNYRLKMTEEKWDKIFSQSDREQNLAPYPRVPRATSVENVGPDFENRSFDPWGSTQSLDAAIDLREARGTRNNQVVGRGSEPFLHHSLSQDTPPIHHHPRQLSDAGNYMFHSQESLENFPLEDQGLPPSGMAGYDQFGPPPRDYHSIGRPPPPRHKEFSPSPAPPMDPGLAPPQFHPNHPPPPNQWQMPMMNHRPPLPNRPPPWEQPGFRPIHPGYESPSPGPSPGPSPRATPPPTPTPPNHMMMGPHPPVPHHQRPHSAPMNRIPMGMPPRQPPPPLWNHGNMPPLAPPRGGPFPGHPPGHPPPPHGRFVPPNFQPEWDEWQQR